MLIFLTGYSGFLGQGLASKWEGHYKTHLIGRGVGNLDLENVDIPRLNELKKIIEGNSSNVLVHLASRLPDGIGFDYGNLEHQEKIFLTMCRHMGIERVCYASSGGIYGYKELAEEHEKANPVDGYSVYKSNIEKHITDLWGTDCVIMRLFFPYGEGQKLPRMMPNLINRVMDRKPITLNGTEGVTINPIYISDAIEAISYLIENKFSGIYNIAGMESVSIKDIVLKIGGILRIKPEIITTNVQNQYMTGSIAKICNLRRDFIKTSLEEGLVETLSRYNR